MSSEYSWHEPYDAGERKTIELSPDELTNAHRMNTAPPSPLSVRSYSADARGRLLGTALALGGAAVGAAYLHDHHDTDRAYGRAAKAAVQEPEDPNADLHDHRTLKERLQESGLQRTWARRQERRLDPWRNGMRNETLLEESDKPFRETVIAAAAMEAGRFYKQEAFAHKIEEDSEGERLTQMTDDAISRAIRTAVQRTHEEGRKERGRLEAEMLTIQVFARVAHDFFREHPEHAVEAYRAFERLIDRLSELNSHVNSRISLEDLPISSSRITVARVGIRRLQFTGMPDDTDRLAFVGEWQGSIPENALAALQTEPSWFLNHREEIRSNRTARRNTMTSIEVVSRLSSTTPEQRRELLALKAYLEAGNH